MNGHEQRKQNDQLGLKWINAFGGLRTAEFGLLMWPNDTHARTRADRVARSWIERELVLARPLPDGAGRLIVLAERGARMLRDCGIDASSGKDIGETRAGKWIAPTDWKHDLMAAGVLANLYQQNYEILAEREIRRGNPTLTKIPDGLAWNPKQPAKALWVEVECARKSGKNMQELANALCCISAGTAPAVSGIKPTRALVAFVATAKDDRSYKLDHRMRVTAAIRRTATQDVTVHWAVCSLLGNGVSHLSLNEELIAAAPVERMMKIMKDITWAENEHGVWSAQYGKRCFYIWEDETMGWSYQLDDTPAGLADSKSDALRGCARLLGESIAAERESLAAKNSP